MLLLQIQDKFTLTPDIAKVIEANLYQLDMNTLKLLAPQLFHIDTFDELEQWMADHLPLVTA